VTLEIFDHHVVGPLGCNCFVVGDAAARVAIVIDPGGDVDKITGTLERHELTVAAIVATHAHFDHLVAADALREITGAPFYMNDGDKPLLDWYEESGRMFLGLELGRPPSVDTSAAEGDVLTAGEVELEVVHTPGHSPGSISLVADSMVFAGDTLFAGSIGRSDLPGGDGETLLEMIRAKLFPLGDETAVHPGHGPSTTIGQERRSNPFVGESRLWLPPS
jgi:glyoxylase-like metal-dependent hydrolase (beta-lactamase superfamily II)